MPVQPFAERVRDAGVRLRRTGIDTVQINVGKLCNLTVLFQPDQEDLPEFLANQEVEIVASLPCYRGERGHPTQARQRRQLLRLDDHLLKGMGSTWQIKLIRMSERACPLAVLSFSLDILDSASPILEEPFLQALATRYSFRR